MPAVKVSRARTIQRYGCDSRFTRPAGLALYCADTIPARNSDQSRSLERVSSRIRSGTTWQLHSKRHRCRNRIRSEEEIYAVQAFHLLQRTHNGGHG